MLKRFINIEITSTRTMKAYDVWYPDTWQETDINCASGYPHFDVLVAIEAPRKKHRPGLNRH